MILEVTEIFAQQQIFLVLWAAGLIPGGGV